LARLANGKQTAYHLYNTSYLDPDKDWGFYPDEVGKSPEDIKGTPSQDSDDNKAEAENKDDPE
jgi:hypothetical protein